MNDDLRKPDLRVVPKAMRNPTAMDDDELAEELSQAEAMASKLGGNWECEARLFRLRSETAFRRSKIEKEDETMIGNPADEISQKEKRRILAEDRKASSYMAHAAANIDEDRGGRYAAVGSSPRVTGASPISYPQQPSNSPWHHDPVPMEEPLGFSVEDHDPVGEPHELARDAAETPSTAGEFGHHMDVADGEGAAATNEPPVAVRPRSSEG